MVLDIIVGLAVCVILFKWIVSLRVNLARAQAAVTDLEKQAEDLSEKLKTVEPQQRFFNRLVTELSLLSEQLHNQVKVRDVSELLLQIVLRSFEPKQVVILIRRRPVVTNPERAACLAVVAVHPPDSSIRPGTEIAIGQGELGFVAEAQLTMNRQDFDRSSLDPDERSVNPFRGFRPQLAAPLVSDKGTLGVIALAGSPYQDTDAKRALQLIARLGAVTLQNAAAYNQMKLSAEIDGLTRIYNKRYMIQALGESIYQAHERLTSFSVFMFDIDNFKNYNDLNGHVAGDQLLRDLALLVQDNVRDDDVFGRFGGEEFLLIFSDTEADKAFTVAEKIRVLISKGAFPFAERQPLGVVSVSGGVATYPAVALDSTGLLKAADEALYAAKKQGRNRVLMARGKYLSGGRGEPALAHQRYSSGIADEEPD